MLSSYSLIISISCVIMTVVEGNNVIVTHDEFLELKNEMMKFKSDLQAKFKSLEQSLRNEIQEGNLKIEHLERTIENAEVQNAELRAKLEKTEMELKKHLKHGTKNTIKANGQPKTPEGFRNNNTNPIPYMTQKYDNFESSKGNLPQKSLFKLPRMLVGSDAPRVAFFTSSLVDRTNVRVHQTLRFSKTDVNFGNCYHTSTGVFSCNTAGIYVFFYNLMCDAGDYIHTSLVKDGVPLNHCTCDGQLARYISCSIATVVNYNIGDSIWVRVEMTDPNNAASFGSEDSFSGFLLY